MVEFPNRKIVRLGNYDYSQGGYYFVTVCTKDRESILSKITATPNVGADIIRPSLSAYGKVVDEAIKSIPLHYEGVYVDKYVIMPNHIHLILVMPPRWGGRIISAPTRSVSTIIGQMKRYVSKKTGKVIWQKSFFDHVIRNEADYLKHWNYIEQNPIKWLIGEEELL